MFWLSTRVPDEWTKNGQAAFGIQPQSAKQIVLEEFGNLLVEAGGKRHQSFEQGRNWL